MKTLHPTALRHQAEYVRQQFHLTVSPDVTVEDMLMPGFWAHHAGRLKKGDLIDVLGDGFDITLRVANSNVGFVNVYVIREWRDTTRTMSISDEEAEQIEASLPDGYVVDHTPRTLWRVRLKDGAVPISRDHKTKVEAITSAIKHHRQMLGQVAA
jgi:hypothetical protein